MIVGVPNMSESNAIITSSNRVEMIRAIANAILADRNEAFSLAISYLNGIGADTSDLKGLADGIGAIQEIYDFDLEIYGFSYQGIEPFYEPSMVSERTFENNGTTTIEDTYSYEESTTDTFSYGFSESFMAGATISGNINLPVVAGGEVSITTSITVASNRQWTESKTRTWKDTVKVPIPPNSTVVVQGFLTTASLDGTFTAQLAPVGGMLRVCFKIGGDRVKTMTIPLPALWQHNDAIPVSGHFKGGEGVGIRTVVQAAQPAT